MSRKTRATTFALIAAALVAAAAGAVTSAASAGTVTSADGSKARPANTGRIAIVQAVPAERVWVVVDGKRIDSNLEGGQVAGPLDLAPGSHEVVFGGGDTPRTTSAFEVVAGTSTDLVLHRPAQVGGPPVVSAYPSPTEAIGPGKARIVLAHTATTAPADVRVDGEAIFTNIANGEYAQADVSAGSHEVALYPSGLDADPILGPISLDVGAGSLTAVYAVGNPMNGSMNVVVRRSVVGAADTTAPTKIETGTAGLVADLAIWTFSPH